VSGNDYFAVINCSTPERVPHHKLDWYFQTRASLKPPRVIWQRGRSNIPRYIAYSPDQFRHFLQIKPIHYNDSGTYMCLDQTTGFYAGVELAICKFLSFYEINKYLFFISDNSHSCAGSIIGLQMTMFICLVLFSLFLSRHTTSES
jgi:hypothetical protein